VLPSVPQPGTHREVSNAFAIAARGVSKSYPGVTALKDVTLEVKAGTVHALVGENGAGKSTLTKVLTGAVVPDSGEIEVKGAVLNGLTPRSAAAHGIGVIYQERQIAPDLTVVDNLLLGRHPRRRVGLISWSAAQRRATELLDFVGLDVDPKAPARSLTVAQLQILEIARALAVDVDVLVMDEPTSTLSGSESERLFELVRRLRAQDVAVIYISHHLDEIFHLADEVTVLRDGRQIRSCPIGEVDLETLVNLMVGRDLARLASRGGAAVDEDRHATTPVIRADNLGVGTALLGVSMGVYAGEVLGVTGAIGSGRRQLARCLAGIDRPDSGAVTVDGANLSGPRDAIGRGIAFLPDDRKRQGLMLDLSVLDNLVIGVVANGRRRIVAPRRLERELSALVDRLRIKTPSLRTPVRQLSGGNQQKVILGRWLATGADVLIFDEPTAGIDVGSKAEIYTLLKELVEQGTAVVIFSSDYEELKIIADRVLVLRRGSIAGEVLRDDISETELLRLEVA
jgi:ABC-type sugar transport system ATPase subunit